MYWTLVFLAVALVTSPFAVASGGATGVAALYVTAVFVTLSLGAAAGALLMRLR